ncbi:response regulator [Paenibacillus sp. 1P07SE]|uniref:GGDEF domain-containing response regulator n=1 Tax=Paenibacillus sp. 1P07SE TaxID=3132209 RepID=UPI0039A61883
MNNYQQTLYNHMKQQFDAWFAQQGTPISSEEVYRFLHSLSGTAGTIGLLQLSAAARGLVDSLQEGDADEWGLDELQLFLQPLADACRDDMEPAASSDMPLADADELPPVVILLDKDEDLLKRVQEVMGRRGYIIIETGSAELAVRQYHTLKPDCLVLDHLSGGFDVLLALEEQLQKEPVPVTIIGSEDQATLRIQAYRLGADDYLVKPLQLSVMAAVLERQLAKKRQVDRLLITDERTGAIRQSRLEDVYDAQLLQAGAAGRPFGMVLITMECLEGIRAGYIDLPGEETLQSVAAWLIDKTVGRRGGKVIRYRWDSFVVLLPDAGSEADTRLAADWRRELEKLPQVKEAPLQVLVGAVVVDEPDRPLGYWMLRLHEAMAPDGLANTERYHKK